MAMRLAAAAAFASGLPDVVVGTKWGNKTWMVGERGFAWQRPLTKADLVRFGNETPPAGDIFAVRVESLDAKDALLAMGLPGFFTIPHFNGYAAVLIALQAARAKDVRAAITDAWRVMAKLKPSRSAARSRARATRPGSGASRGRAGSSKPSRNRSRTAP